MLSPEAKQLALKVRRRSFATFSARGGPLTGIANVIVVDEGEGFRRLLSADWSDQLLDWQNELTESLLVHSQELLNSWNDVVIEGDSLMRFDAAVPCVATNLQLPEKNALKAANRIMSNLSLGVAETHFMQYVRPVGFRRLAELILRERIPCGCDGHLAYSPISVI